MDIYNEYVSLEAALKALEFKKTMLRQKIVETLQKEGKEKLENNFGSFTVAKKASWEYSKATNDFEEKLKIKKLNEQKKGIAIVTHSHYLLYKAKIND